MNDYVGRMNHVGAAVMRGIALGLKLPDPNFFETRNQGQDPYWCMRIIHYPPLADAVNTEGPVSEQGSMQTTADVNSGAGQGQAVAESALSGKLPACMFSGLGWMQYPWLTSTYKA